MINRKIVTHLSSNPDFALLTKHFCAACWTLRKVGAELVNGHEFNQIICPVVGKKISDWQKNMKAYNNRKDKTYYDEEYFKKNKFYR